MGGGVIFVALLRVKDFKIATKDDRQNLIHKTNESTTRYMNTVLEWNTTELCVLKGVHPREHLHDRFQRTIV